MSVLEIIPVDVIVHILSEWISLKSLKNFDIALTNHSLRECYIQWNKPLLQRIQEISTYEDHYDEFKLKRIHNWKISRNIRILSLEMTWRDDVCVHEKFRELKTLHLTIDENSNSSPITVQTLLLGLPMLEELYLCGPNIISDVPTSVVATFPLKRLLLHSRENTNDHSMQLLEYISSCAPHLEQLSLFRGTIEWDAYLSVLPRFRALHTLTLETLACINIHKTISSDMIPVRTFPNIKTVELIENEDSQNLLLFLLFFPKLTTIIFDGIEYDETFQTPFQWTYFENLESLFIVRLHYTSCNWTIASPANTLNFLRTLQISPCLKSVEQYTQLIQSVVCLEDLLIYTSDDDEQYTATVSVLNVLLKTAHTRPQLYHTFQQLTFCDTFVTKPALPSVWLIQVLGKFRWKKLSLERIDWMVWEFLMNDYPYPKCLQSGHFEFADDEMAVLTKDARVKLKRVSTWRYVNVTRLHFSGDWVVSEAFLTSLNQNTPHLLPIKKHLNNIRSIQLK